MQGIKKSVLMHQLPYQTTHGVCVCSSVHLYISFINPLEFLEAAYTIARDGIAYLALLRNFFHL